MSFYAMNISSSLVVGECPLDETKECMVWSPEVPFTEKLSQNFQLPEALYLILFWPYIFIGKGLSG